MSNLGWSIIGNAYYETEEDGACWASAPSVIERGIWSDSVAGEIALAFQRLATGPRNCQVVRDEWADRIVARWHADKKLRHDEWIKAQESLPPRDYSKDFSGLANLIASDHRYGSIIDGINDDVFNTPPLLHKLKEVDKLKEKMSKAISKEIHK